jgi:predicted DNA-binding protein (UPF0251 family)
MSGIGASVVSLDEFEALRLCDHENCDQEEAGRRMGVSRGTIQRLVYSARRRVIEAILKNNALLINLREGEDCYVGMHPNQRQRRSRRHGE